MKKAFKSFIYLIGGGLWLGLVIPASGATTIFNNSTNDLVKRFDPGTTQVGDQIVLAGVDRMLTMFSFEYWGTNTASPSAFTGPVKAEVRFYKNDGAEFNGYKSPGTKFYDSGLFNINPTERSTLVFLAGIDFPSGGLFIPTDNMTWSVEFTGMNLSDSVGLDLYSPPTVGQDYPDFWAYDGANWLLMTNNNNIPINFGAMMNAVPEPSYAVLSLLGGLGLLLAVGKLRRVSA
jgi:hypothetical protein